MLQTEGKYFSIVDIMLLCDELVGLTLHSKCERHYVAAHISNVKCRPTVRISLCFNTLAVCYHIFHSKVTSFHFISFT